MDGHAWQLTGIGEMPDGRMAMTYGCAEVGCDEEWLVGPDDVPPDETGPAGS